MKEISEYSDRASRLIRRILRVDHAGEHGAIAIYEAQILASRQKCPDILPWLEEVLSHECRHRDLFRQAMPRRAAKPCRAMWVWGVGGKILGGVTSLFGREGILVCTQAVERTVHRHLLEQLAFLKRFDVELATIVGEIIFEEVEHLEFAERQLQSSASTAKKSAIQFFLAPVVSMATEVLICISTRGDSILLHTEMRRLKTECR